MLSERLKNLAIALAKTHDDEGCLNKSALKMAVSLVASCAIDARELEQRIVPPGARVGQADLPDGVASLEFERARRCKAETES